MTGEKKAMIGMFIFFFVFTTLGIYLEKHKPKPMHQTHHVVFHYQNHFQVDSIMAKYRLDTSSFSLRDGKWDMIYTWEGTGIIEYDTINNIP